MAAWLLVFLSVSVVERLCRDEPAGFRMLAIIGVLLYAMKSVVVVESHAQNPPKLTLPRWIIFGVLWPGMRPAIFAAPRRVSLTGGRELLWKGTRHLIMGAVLIVLARLEWAVCRDVLNVDTARCVATILLLPGLSLMLHFGFFNIVAAFWRFQGFDCRPLFRDPLKSKSLTEFWGRRWNLAFSEMTTIGVYRPTQKCLGKPSATVISFLASGVLHELAISLPVKAGFGLPLAYFAIQSGLVLLERSLENTRWRIGRRDWTNRVWTLGWLLIPLPILFHRPFLKGVVWPLIGIEG